VVASRHGKHRSETNLTPSPAPASDVRVTSDAIERALAQTDLEGARRAALDRLRIVRGAMTWDELRAAFADRLRDLSALR
jgi:hypothetical protein